MFYLRSWLSQLAQRLSLPTGLRSRKKVSRLFRKRAGVRLQLEELESRITPTTNVWNGTGSWTTAANWSLGLPTTGQDVEIQSGAVTHSSGSDTLNTITVDSGAALSVTGGSAITALNTITVNSSATLTITGGSAITAEASTGPQVIDSGTINIGDATTYGILHINAASGELAGNGSVVLGASTSNALVQYYASQTFQIDAGITVSGQSGEIGFGSTDTLNNLGTIDANVNGGVVTVNLGNGTNAGTIAVSSNDTLSILAGGGNTWLNTGTIQATTGGILGLDSTGSGDFWHSQGTLTSTNSTVDLGGQFTQNDLGTFSFNSGSVVNITGTLGGNVDLTGDFGLWSLLGGTLTNGTLSGGGPTINATTTQSTLNNYVLSSVINLTNGSIIVTGGLTLAGGTLQVGDANNGNMGLIEFSWAHNRSPGLARSPSAMGQQHPVNRQRRYRHHRSRHHDRRPVRIDQRQRQPHQRRDDPGLHVGRPHRRHNHELHQSERRHGSSGRRRRDNSAQRAPGHGWLDPQRRHRQLGFPRRHNPEGYSPLPAATSRTI